MSGKKCVYMIKNVKNGKCYIGSTTNRNKRWKEHKSRLKQNIHINDHLQNAYNKYGFDSFEFSVLEWVEGQNDVLEREQYYLDNRAPEYNIAKDARSPMLGKEFTEEHKDKISEAMRKSYLDREHHLQGKHLPKETKEKMSQSNKGEKHPCAKLTKKEVKIIKHLLQGSRFLQKEIGKMFGVSKHTVSQIKLGQSWNHVSI